MSMIWTAMREPIRVIEAYSVVIATDIFHDFMACFLFAGLLAAWMRSIGGVKYPRGLYPVAYPVQLI